MTEDQPLLTPDEIDALVSGQYQDVFSIMGCHPLRSGEQWVIRTFQPGATEVSLLDFDNETLSHSLARIHPSGLFETIIDSKPPSHYQYLVDQRNIVEDVYRFPTTLNDNELYWFNEGAAEHAYRWLGANPVEIDGVRLVRFCVWAPSASRVSVVGDFNHWDGRCHVMRKHPAAGVWEIAIPGIKPYDLYKFEIVDAEGHLLPLKSDPYARSMQHPPQTASRVVIEQPFHWNDQDWMSLRASTNWNQKPIAMYEVHVGSWRRKPDQDNRYLSYYELADELIPYVKEMGFTHIQCMPLSEYPFDGSWGYQPLGMFAPSIRFGVAEELKYFIDRCHQENIGVLLDWVPGHFPTDVHGLGRFDGTCLYEHEDKRQGFHPDWNTLIYNYSRSEVVSYLISNANYWLEEFHFDGLRVDAVASMLYLDYSREEGEWIPNEHGGRENTAAIEFLKNVNARVRHRHPGVLMVAEESTAWPGVSRSVHDGGLGFSHKWNMGWMNDSLRYIQRDPVHRKFHHNDVTFSILYAWDEHFILPLSHDEVVHGKGSLLNKMPGDDWQKYANLRLFLGYMWAHPGKKLLFQGGEFAQSREWNHDQSLDWHLLDQPAHRGISQLVRDLNSAYRRLPALHEGDSDSQGFQWLLSDQHEQSILAWARYSNSGEQMVVAVVNMTPNTHFDYRLPVPRSGWYRECINTDSQWYGGSGQGNGGGRSSLPNESLEAGDSTGYLCITVPPLAMLLFEYQPESWE